MVAPKIGQARRHDMGCDVVRGGEAHTSAGAPVVPAGLALDCQNRFLHVLGLQTNGLTALGQAVSSLAAIKQGARRA